MTENLWHAVARSRDLKRTPLRVMFDGKGIVLFRHAGGLSALHDQCPHRLVELSRVRMH